MKKSPTSLRRLLLALALLLLRAAPASAQAPDPAATKLFFNADAKTRLADSALSQKQPAAANANYADAIRLLRQLQSEHPAYSPEVVTRRLATLQQKLDSLPSPAGPDPEPAKPAPAKPAKPAAPTKPAKNPATAKTPAPGTAETFISKGPDLPSAPAPTSPALPPDQPAAQPTKVDTNKPIPINQLLSSDFGRAPTTLPAEPAPIATRTPETEPAKPEPAKPAETPAPAPDRKTTGQQDPLVKAIQENQALKQRLATAETKVTELSATLSTLSKNNPKDAKGKTADLEEKLKTAANERLENLKTINDLRTQLAGAPASSPDATTRQREAAQTRLDTLASQLETANKKIIELQKNLDGKDSETATKLAEFQARLAVAEREKTENTRKSLETEKKLADARAELEKRQSARAELDADTKQRLDSAATEKLDTLKKIGQLRTQLAEAQKKADELEQQKTSIARDADAGKSFKSDLDAAIKERTALSVQLGETKAALATLEAEKKTGTLTRAATESETQKKLQAVTAEADLLKTKAKDMQRVATDNDALKKKVEILTASLDSAKDELLLLKSARKTGSGKPGAPDQGLIEMKSRLDQASDQLAALKKSEEDARTQLASVRDQLAQSQKHAEEIETEKKSLETSQEDTTRNAQTITRLTDELEVANKTIESLRKQESDLSAQPSAAPAGQIGELSAQLDETRKKLAALETERESLKASSSGPPLSGDLQKALDEVKSLRSEKERLQQEADKVLGLIVEKENLQRRIEELEKTATTSGSLTAPLAVADPATTTTTTAPPAAPPDKGIEIDVSGNDDPAAPGVATQSRPKVPERLAALAQQAREQFDMQDYATAERTFQKILDDEPDNLFALSNIGVVRFRMGKMPQAEVALKHAVEVDPSDAFSYETLGIVYYSTNKLDDAVAVLTKALAINPKSATAHNFLGIAASKKGWHEAAEDELRKAITLNPTYPDAHFNLAVLYASARPPSLSLAKKHYELATKYGAANNKMLEDMIYHPAP